MQTDRQTGELDVAAPSAVSMCATRESSPTRRRFAPLPGVDGPAAAIARGRRAPRSKRQEVLLPKDRETQGPGHK